MSNAVALLKQTVELVQTTETESLNVHFISKRMGYSRWQLQRTFAAWVEMSLSDYLRDVKLSRAADLLLSSSNGVLDIALECGFGSQEAFTRAFKKRFDITPGQYRSRGIIDDISLALIIPENKTWSKAMNIKLETKPAMTFIGMVDYFNGHGMENANNFEVIPKLWDKLNTETHAQPNEVSVWYGLIYESDQPEKGGLRYLAGYEAAEGPVTLSEQTSQSVAEQLYAIVPHHGYLKNLGDTLDAFYGQWLPESGYKMANDVNIEVYDARFNPESENNYFETWVPVVKAV
jgi:AraC family transcriptional regulator